VPKVSWEKKLDHDSDFCHERFVTDFSPFQVPPGERFVPNDLLSVTGKIDDLSYDHDVAYYLENLDRYKIGELDLFEEMEFLERSHSTAILHDFCEFPLGDNDEKFRSLVVSHISPEGRPQVFDLGCGLGRTSEYALKIRRNAQFSLIDRHIDPLTYLYTKFSFLGYTGRYNLHLQNMFSDWSCWVDERPDLVLTAFSTYILNESLHKLFYEYVFSALNDGGQYINATKSYFGAAIHLQLMANAGFRNLDVLMGGAISKNLDFFVLRGEKFGTSVPNADYLVEFQRIAANFEQ